MKNKKLFIFIIIAVIVIIAAGVTATVLYLQNKESKEETKTNETTINLETNEIVISKYNSFGEEEKNKIRITSKDEINEVSGYVSKLQPLSKEEMVELELLKDVVIKYNDDITISIQLGEEKYCYYNNKAQNISSLARIPEGLYEYVESKLDKGTGDVKTNRIEITTYNPKNALDQKTTVITSKSDIDEITKYVSKLKPLSESEKVELALIGHIVIKYNDDVTISMQIGQKDYCSYRVKSKNVASLSHIPDGFYDYLVKKLGITE